MSLARETHTGQVEEKEIIKTPGGYLFRQDYNIIIVDIHCYNAEQVRWLTCEYK